MIKAVVFDLDGTLLDTLTDIVDAVNGVLAEDGFPGHEIDLYKIMIGEGIENLVWRALPEEHRDEKEIARYVTRIRDRYRERGYVNTKPYDGIEDLLNELVRRNIKIAVLTNKPHENAVRQMAMFFSKYEFEAIEGAKSDEPIKPDPTIAIDICHRMNVAPAECIFLGDTDVDMVTATRAGMLAIGALWGFRSGDELAAYGAEELIAHPMDLLACLKKSK